MSMLTLPSLKEHCPQKALGQHFLLDQGISQKIAEASLEGVEEGSRIIEIGPGLGALSLELIKRYPASQCTLVEIDSSLAEKLSKHPKLGGCEILNVDALELRFQELSRGRPLRIVGNLPYNISTKLIANCLEDPALTSCDALVFMVQKEVAIRLCAREGAEKRGRLGLLREYFCTEAEYLFDVPPQAFNPVPKVVSSVIRLRLKREKPSLDFWKDLSSFAASAFQHKRKKLFNALKMSHDLNTEQFAAEEEHQFLLRRPSELSLKNWIKVYHFCKGLNEGVESFRDSSES